jgi:hypothetical protein
MASWVMAFNCQAECSNGEDNRIGIDTMQHSLRRRPIYELHYALSNLLELTEILMAETGHKQATDGAISKAKTALQIHEGAATAELRDGL